MTRKFPYVTGSKTINRKDCAPSQIKRVECCACDSPANSYVTFEFSPYRNDDETYACCLRHKDMAYGMPTKFLAHVETKTQFLDRRAQEKSNEKFN